jgi:enediyne biosynthesis protein E3
MGFDERFVMAAILQKLLSISPAETSFARRKFHFLCDSARQRLEQVGETFLCGYHLALGGHEMELLAERLNRTELEFRGFAFEGAAMGLDILDQLQPWKKRRIDEFLRGAGRPHVYMVHVGIGWSMARWRFGIEGRLARLDPMLRWLALDGFGFHEGYFHWSRYETGDAPAFLTRLEYGLRAFRQGLGRSLWFAGGADPEFIAAAIARFPEPQHDDLWSGIGLACTYAGGVGDAELNTLRLASGVHWPHLAQGAVFAAGARQRAGNMNSQTETACLSLCGISAARASELCEETLRDVNEGKVPAYEQWRRLIRAELQRGQDFYGGFLVGAGDSSISCAGRL